MENVLSKLNLSSALVEAIGWTVLHSLWQGTLIALVVGVLAAFIQRQSAVVRYWTALAGLFASLIWSGITFVKLYTMSTDAPVEMIALVESASTPDFIVVESSRWDFLFQYFEAQLPLVFTCWLLGMSVFALRFLGGIAYLKYLRVHSLPVEEDCFLQLFDSLRERIGISFTVELSTSRKINVPMAMGFLKPLVLLPAGTLLALSPTQLEAVLAHELAHIKRRDYLANILQSVVEVIFYYHPAIWWLSAQVRRERENCCDDLAVAACGDDLAYAKALLSLQAYAKGAPNFAMAFSNRKDHLLNRVKRILNHPINRNSIMEKFSIASLVLICLLVLSMRDNSTASETSIVEVMETEALPEIRVDVTTDFSATLDGEQTITVMLDTLPKGKVNIEMTKDGERIEAKLDNGKIQELKVNGKVQPASAYDAYLPLLEEMMVPPPAPPAPPAPPRAPRAPSAVPTPPAPPAPPTVIKTGQTKVEVKRSEDEEGNMIVFVTTDENEAPMRIKVTNGDRPKVIINDETLVDGEELVFITADEKVEWNEAMFSEEQRAELERAHAEVARVQERVVLRQEQVAREMEVKGAEMEKRIAEMEKVREEQIGAMEHETSIAAAEAREKAEAVRLRQNLMLNAMFKDGLIESTDNYKIKLSNESLRIDGKKQPASVFQKYLKLYEAQYGPRDKFNVTIQRSKN